MAVDFPPMITAEALLLAQEEGNRYELGASEADARSGLVHLDLLERVETVHYLLHVHLDAARAETEAGAAAGLQTIRDRMAQADGRMAIRHRLGIVEEQRRVAHEALEMDEEDAFHALLQFVSHRLDGALGERLEFDSAATIQRLYRSKVARHELSARQRKSRAAVEVQRWARVAAVRQACQTKRDWAQRAVLMAREEGDLRGDAERSEEQARRWLTAEIRSDWAEAAQAHQRLALGSDQGRALGAIADEEREAWARLTAEGGAGLQAVRQAIQQRGDAARYQQWWQDQL